MEYTVQDLETNINRAYRENYQRDHHKQSYGIVGDGILEST